MGRSIRLVSNLPGSSCFWLAQTSWLPNTHGRSKYGLPWSVKPPALPGSFLSSYAPAIGRARRLACCKLCPGMESLSPPGPTATKPSSTWPAAYERQPEGKRLLPAPPPLQQEVILLRLPRWHTPIKTASIPQRRNSPKQIFNLTTIGLLIAVIAALIAFLSFQQDRRTAESSAKASATQDAMVAHKTSC